MAAKYHIKDDGTPGICSAASTDSCPKSQSGDSFHGTLEEATVESERRFAEEHGTFATASRPVSKLTKPISERASAEELEARGYSAKSAAILAGIRAQAVRDGAVASERYLDVEPGSWDAAYQLADAEIDDLNDQIHANRHGWESRYTVTEHAAVVKLSSMGSSQRIREMAERNYGESAGALLPEAIVRREELYSTELDHAAVAERLESDPSHLEGYRAMTAENSRLHNIRLDLVAKRNFAEAAARLSKESVVAGKQIPAGYGPHSGIYDLKGNLLALESSALSGTEITVDGSSQKFRRSTHSNPEKAAEANAKKGVRMGIALAPTTIRAAASGVELKPIRQTAATRKLNIGI